MKTVTIPNDYHPYEVEVNGKEYRFPAGATVSVPDEVAAVIENYYKLQPKEKPTDGGALPYVSKENDGDVLTVKDGAWTTGEGGNGNVETFDGVVDSGIDFGTVLKLEEYMNTPKFFAVAHWDGASSETDLCVILDDYLYRFHHHCIYCWEVYYTSGTIVYLVHASLSGWGEGMQITLPPTIGQNYGDVLTVGVDGDAVWKTGASFPKVTITQEDLGSKIMNIGAFTAQANDTVKMKTFSFTGTAGRSIAGKIMEILGSAAGFIEIEGFGVQAFAYKVSQKAVSTTQTFGYFSDPTQPFLFSADYVIQDLAEGNVDLNFYVQKINVAS